MAKEENFFHKSKKKKSKRECLKSQTHSLRPQTKFWNSTTLEAFSYETISVKNQYDPQLKCWKISWISTIGMLRINSICDQQTVANCMWNMVDYDFFPHFSFRSNVWKCSLSKYCLRSPSNIDSHSMLHTSSIFVASFVSLSLWTKIVIKSMSSWSANAGIGKCFNIPQFSMRQISLTIFRSFFLLFSFPPHWQKPLVSYSGSDADAKPESVKFSFQSHFYQCSAILHTIECDQKENRKRDTTDQDLVTHFVLWDDSVSERVDKTKNKDKNHSQNLFSWQKHSIFFFSHTIHP